MIPKQPIYKFQAIQILGIPRRKFELLGLKPIKIITNKFNVKTFLYDRSEVDALIGSEILKKVMKHRKNKWDIPTQYGLFRDA